MGGTGDPPIESTGYPIVKLETAQQHTIEQIDICLFSDATQDVEVVAQVDLADPALKISSK